MKVIAVANISNGKETIGFRILDVDTKEIKDVSINNIREVLINKKVTISNLTIKEGRVVGSNGSIDRLPKLINGHLVGKSPLIIIEQIYNIGYLVSDFKGTIIKLTNDKAISYAKKQGIANGKITSRGGVEFISSISGEYKKSNKSVELDLYTGELVNSIKPLKPILIYNRVMQNRQLEYRDGKLGISYLDGKLNVRQVYKGIVTETDKNTLYKEYVSVYNVEDPEDRAKIYELLDYEGVQDGIEYSIDCVNNGADKDSDVLDEKTGIYLPSDNIAYDTVVVEKSDKASGLSDKDKQFCIDCLKIMNVPLVLKTTINSKQLALERVCDSTGISYDITCPDIAISIRNLESLERIYYDHLDYDNVIVDGKYMTVVGLDGVYKYDMNKIHTTYNRKVYETNKSKKANAIGVEYTEVISDDGVLQYLCNPGDVLVISNDVKTIRKSSIVLKGNTRIIFGSSIEECDSDCFDTVNSIYLSDESLKYVDIESSNCLESIIKALKELDYVCDVDMELNLKFDIDVEMYANTFIRLNTNIKKINVNGSMDYVTDTFISGVIAYIVKNKLNNLKIFDEEIEVSIQSGYNGDISKVSLNYHTMKHAVADIKLVWKEFRGKASKEMRDNMDKYVGGIENKWGKVKKEVNERLQELRAKSKGNDNI